jgi:DNA polymerase-3 subunit delta'
MSEIINISESVLSVLDSFFADGRCPHALLIDGGGVPERQKLSLLAAKMIVCSDQSRTPCGACENCRKASEGIHPDIITLEKPDDKRFYVKADVKKLVGDAYLTPNDALKKVYILPELQDMTEESQNLLLKVLEEPPRYTAFVLTAQSSNVVIGTVLSRVVRLRLGNAEAVEYSEKAVDIVKALCKATTVNSEFEKVKATAPLDGNKKLTSEVLMLMVAVLRDAIALKSGGKILLQEFKAEAELLGAAHNLKKLLDMYNVVEGIYQSLENNPNYTLLTAVLCAGL